MKAARRSHKVSAFTAEREGGHVQVMRQYRKTLIVFGVVAVAAVAALATPTRANALLGVSVGLAEFDLAMQPKKGP